MKFTFLTVTYNHEKFIIQHLESIKYQILQYGKGFEFQLVITDDCSKDRTISYIKKWLGTNAPLFKNIDLLENKTNMGTCNNYCKGVRAIKYDFFKALAGDDIYAKDNLFEAAMLLGENDVVITPIGPFEDEKIFNDKKIESRIYSMYKFADDKFEKNRERRLIFPMTPGLFIKKSLLTDEVLDFVGKFKYIEDRPLSVKLYEMNDTLRIATHDKVVVLYRYHSNAITKTVSESIRRDFNNDNTQLNNHIIRTTSSVFVKLMCKYKNRVSNISNPIFSTILNIDMWMHRINFIFDHAKYKKKMTEIKEASFFNNQEYLEKIIQEDVSYDGYSSPKDPPTR